MDSRNVNVSPRSLVLLVGAGLFVRTLVNLRQSMLFGVTPHDASTILLAALGLINQGLDRGLAAVPPCVGYRSYSRPRCE